MMDWQPVYNVSCLSPIGSWGRHQISQDPELGMKNDGWGKGKCTQNIYYVSECLLIDIEPIHLLRAVAVPLI